LLVSRILSQTFQTDSEEGNYYEERRLRDSDVKRLLIVRQWRHIQTRTVSQS